MNEQPGQAAVSSGPNMRWNTSNCERPSKSSDKRFRAFVCLEGVLLVDPHPRQLASLPRELVAAAGQLLLPLEQLHSRGKPLLARSDLVLRHRKLLPWSYGSTKDLA